MSRALVFYCDYYKIRRELEGLGAEGGMKEGATCSSSCVAVACVQF